MKAALERLSPKCRAAVLLHRRAQLTYAEVAVQLGVSVKTVGRWGAFLWALASGITALASGYAGIFAARLLLGIAEAPGMIGNQKATGYEATIVSGEIVYRRGEATGALPGRLVRAS